MKEGIDKLEIQVSQFIQNRKTEDKSVQCSSLEISSLINRSLDNTGEQNKKYEKHIDEVMHMRDKIAEQAENANIENNHLRRERLDFL